MHFLTRILVFCVCSSLSAEIRNSRIINGEVSESGRFPYAVAFYYKTSVGYLFCSGSLIDQSWVLTSAQCLEGALEFIIYLGVNNLKDVQSNGVLVTSTSYVRHPGYNSSSLENDIGLILLPSPVNVSDNINLVELPEESLGANKETLALGWGVTNETQELPSNLLHHAKLTTLSNAVCRRTYGDFIQDTMICLSGEDNQGICSFDSGGPLVQTMQDNRHIQVGVASFYSATGCENNYPSGYTRVYEYSGWIKSVIQEASVTDSPASEEDDTTTRTAEEDVATESLTTVTPDTVTNPAQISSTQGVPIITIPTQNSPLPVDSSDGTSNTILSVLVITTFVAIFF